MQGQSPKHELTDSIVQSFKFYKINQALKRIKKLKDSRFKKIALFQYYYYKRGEFKENLLKKTTDSLTEKDKIIYNYTLGDFHKKRKTPNDSLAFLYYNKAFSKAKEKNDTLLITIILSKLSDHFFKYKDTHLEDLKKYTNLYSLYAQDSIDMFWKNYYSIVVKIATNEKAYKKKKSSIFLDSDFKNTKYYAKGSNFLKGKIYQLEGVYYNYILEKPQEAANLFKEAVSFYEQGNFYLSKRGAFDNQINYGICLYNSKKYEEAINAFENGLFTNYDVKNLNTLSEELIISKWLYKSYKKIKNQSKALYYSERKDALKDLIKKYEYAISMKKIEQKNKLQEKNTEIRILKESNNFLYTNIATLLPILGFVIIGLILTFYLYKRYKKKSTILEEEQSETLQKLDELKQIVIKNHIVLKDKTKVYITDLMYIQSDDHYLKVFTQDGKNRFVRGKLSQLKEELPPNFIQCHRSYIVNRNFIKQIHSKTIVLISKEEIPLSRTYKDTL